jgi:hypothetical protein
VAGIARKTLDTVADVLLFGRVYAAAINVVMPKLKEIMAVVGVIRPGISR